MAEPATGDTTPMTDAAKSHALRLLTARALSPSPSNMAMAERRVFHAGRLAELGGHMVAGILAASVVEYGDADAMAHGSMFARVVLDARSQGEWSTRAEQLLELEVETAKKGIRLTLAIYRATRRDRWAAAARWHWSRLFG